MTVTLKSKKPIVVPESIRRKAGLRAGDKIEVQVSGRSITIVPKASAGEDYPMETVMRIIKEERENPMSAEELAALDADLKAFALKHSRKIRIKGRDIPRLIHEFRARRRSS